jgi:lipoprotein NlpI
MAVLACLAMTCVFSGQSASPDQPERASVELEFERQLEAFNRQWGSGVLSASQHSQRGDLLFFLGRFPEAVNEYTEMARNVPDVENSNWRRGLALYYAGNFSEAAAQFRRCYELDKVDRENGIWDFLSRARLGGVEQARQEMLAYHTGDREPFDDLYRLFQGKLSKEAVLEHLRAARLEEQDRQGRLFYANLYIGLNELIQGQPRTARTFLQTAVENQWPLDAGYGPHYMWQIARLQLKLLPPAP